MRNWPIFIILFSGTLFAHETQLEQIEVQEQEESQSLVNFVPSVTQLKGTELGKRRQTSLGDTLSSEAGIQSTSFGPNSSRPVIHGLDGDRVRILQNGLGTLDASTQSLDHAIPVDTLTVDQIEVARGPMSLLYGPTAIGGVVNIVTNRIHYEYEEGFFTKALVQGESVNNGTSTAAHLNYGKNNWMFHMDGSTRNLSDVKIPGYARSRKERQVDPQSEDKKNKLPNSFNQQDNVAVAATRIFDRGYAGLSFNHYNTLYGSVAEELVSIDMTQNRFEFHSEYRPQGSIFKRLKLKSAQSDYSHKEIEGGATMTTFKNKGNESRFEAFSKSGNWSGVTGLQTQMFKFEADGDEAFLPTSDNQKVALFGFQQLSLGKHAYRLATRFEEHKISKKHSDRFGSSDHKNYLGMNASLGHCYDFSKTHTLESTLSYTERAPTFQELFASGDHIATGTYERGDSGLKKEKATGLELTFKNDATSNQFTGSLYTQVYKDYIAMNPTGVNSSEGNPEYNYEQVDALFYGIDLNNRSEVQKLQSGSVFLINKFDLVRAKDTDSGKNIPRISPPRLSAGLEYVSDKWSADFETQYVTHQTKTAPTEKRTDDYFMTNLGYSYQIVGEKTAFNLFARVRNIFDVEARNHVSTLKDVAPLPGRNLILGAQFQL